MSDKISVPARIIYQMDLEIKRQKERLAKLAAHVLTLQTERDRMVPMDTPTHSRAKGGHARMEGMSAEQRADFAKSGARARWGT